jgi:hypothetical protein
MLRKPQARERLQSHQVSLARFSFTPHFTVRGVAGCNISLRRAVRIRCLSRGRQSPFDLRPQQFGSRAAGTWRHCGSNATVYLTAPEPEGTIQRPTSASRKATERPGKKGRGRYAGAHRAARTSSLLRRNTGVTGGEGAPAVTGARSPGVKFSGWGWELHKSQVRRPTVPAARRTGHGPDVVR